MTHCTFHKSLRSWRTVFCKKLLFQRTAVHAYPNRDISFTAGFNHRFHPIHRADISGVYPYLVDTSFRRRNGKAIVKVDIRHKRDRDFLFDSRDKLNGFHVWYSRSYYFTASFFKLHSLLNRAFYVRRRHIEH